MSKGMLGNLPLSTVRGPVGSLLENLASEKGDLVLQELKRFNKREACWLSEGVVKPKKPGILARAGYFTACELVGKHDPKEFYQTRTGLWVWSDFVERIVAVAGPTEAGRKFNKASSWKLNKDTTGEALKKERPKSIWKATDFCAWLSVKLTNQPKGEEGELLNTGWANLFLVEGVNNEAFVVYVSWNSVCREWRVIVWRLGSEWYAGHRFVSKPIDL